MKMNVMKGILALAMTTASAFVFLGCKTEEPTPSGSPTTSPKMNGSPGEAPTPSTSPSGKMDGGH